MQDSSLNARAPLPLMLAFGLGVALGGCAPESDNSTDRESGLQAASGDSAAMKDGSPEEKVSTTGFIDEEGDVPGWVSDAFPIFPGSEVVAASEINDSKLIVSFYSHSPDGQAPVFDWFKEQYSQNGWTVDDTQEKNGALDATHSDGQSAKINVTTASGVTSYVLTASKG